MEHSRKSSFSNEESSSAGSGKNLPELPLPLLQEIDELINKERTLLQLQLLDQELEAELWKSKYDELKEKVIEDVYHEEEDIQVVETLADLEDQEVNNFYVPTDPHYLLISRIENMVGNFNSINFTHEIFFRVMKELFSPRKSLQYLDHPDVTILWLAHCHLNQTYADILYNILKNPKLDALDISHNLINAEMMYNFLSVLANRRKTPQYLLFHGNMLYATQAKTFNDFMKVLSEDTWGLSLSLQDYSNHPKEMMEKEMEKSRRKSRGDELLAYRDLVKPTLKAYSFLKALNDHLIKLKASNDGLTVRKKPKPVNKLGSIAQRSLFPFRYLTVFGLTDCHLSRQSIDLLQESYDLLKESLTELDLSYCYMGLYGIATLQHILSEKDSQLVSLNLKGNVLYDPGALAISEAVKKNKTLTNLNLSSNGISMVAIRSILNQLAKSLTLHRVDLRTNDCTAEEIVEIHYKLQEHGSLVDFLFDDYSHPDSLLSQMMKIHPKFYCQPQLRKLYCPIEQARTIIDIDFNTLVMQYPRQVFQQPFMLQWFFRPMPILSFDQVQQTLMQNLHKRVSYVTKTVSVPLPSSSSIKKPRGSTELSTIDTTLRETEDFHHSLSRSQQQQPKVSQAIQKKILFEDPFLHIGLLFNIVFEVRLLQKNVIVWQFEKPFNAPELPNRDFFTTSIDWFHFYEILPQFFPPQPPGEQSWSGNHHSTATTTTPTTPSLQHCRLQVRLKCVPTSRYLEEQFAFDSSFQALHFQVKACFLTHFSLFDATSITTSGSSSSSPSSSSYYYYLGGDPKENLVNPTSASAASSSFSLLNRSKRLLENEERNLAIQEAFERETWTVLFDPIHYWFQDHIFLRGFEFAFAHLTKKCKIRWSSKLYVKQYSLTSAEEEEELEIEEASDEEEEEEEQEEKASEPPEKRKTKIKRKSKGSASAAFPDHSFGEGKEAFPWFKLDYRQILEDPDFSSTAPSMSRSTRLFQELDENDDENSDDNEDEEEEEERLLYEELLEIDARKKRPKFYDYLTYEWTVSVYEAVTNTRRVVETVCCDYQNEELLKEQRRLQRQQKQEEVEGIYDETNNVETGAAGPAIEPMLLPWMWERFEVEIDQLRPSDFIILSGRVVQKELSSDDDNDDNDDPTEEREDVDREAEEDWQQLNKSKKKRSRLRPRKKDLRRLMRFLSIQVKQFESYLSLDLAALATPGEGLGQWSEKIPFIYPPEAIYALPSYELPYEQYLKHQAIIFEAERDLSGFEDYFLQPPMNTAQNTAASAMK